MVVLYFWGPKWGHLEFTWKTNNRQEFTRKTKKPPQAEAQGGVIKRESGKPDLFGLVQYLGPTRSCKVVLRPRWCCMQHNGGYRCKTCMSPNDSH